MFSDFFGGRPLFFGGSVTGVGEMFGMGVRLVGRLCVGAFGAGGDLRFFGGVVGICSMDGVAIGAGVLLGEGSPAIVVELFTVV